MISDDQEPGSLLKATVKDVVETVTNETSTQDSTKSDTTSNPSESDQHQQNDLSDNNLSSSNLTETEQSDLVNGIDNIKINENDSNDNWNSSNKTFVENGEENKCDSGGGGKEEINEDKDKVVGEAKSSPMDSEEDEGRYSISDADDPPAVTNTNEIIRIPG